MNAVETYDRVIIRPWTRLDLTVSKENLEKYLNSVLSKIIIKPGILLQALKKEYCPFIQPMYVGELVEVKTYILF